MLTSGTQRMLRRVVLCSALFLLPALVTTQARADEGEGAIWARQGFMNLVQWEAGPLFGMAKGDIAYDAGAAQQHAARLKLLYEYPYTDLFLPGTSKADRPGKTRALPKIWEDRDQFEQFFREVRARVDALVEQAGNGQQALTAAVSAMGKACGNCHNSFRAKEY